MVNSKIYEEIIRITGGSQIIGTPTVGSFGLKTVRVESEKVDFHIKWGSDEDHGELIGRELAWFLQNPRFPGAARLVAGGGSPQHSFIATETLPGTWRQDWTPKMLENASYVLEDIKGSGFFGSANLWLYRARILAELSRNFVDLPSGIWIDAYECMSLVNSWKKVRSHVDAHIFNWVVDGDNPILIDFDNVGLAPVGWDETFMASTIRWNDSLEDFILDVVDTEKARLLTAFFAVVTECYRSRSKPKPFDALTYNTSVQLWKNFGGVSNSSEEGSQKTFYDLAEPTIISLY